MAKKTSKKYNSPKIKNDNFRLLFNIIYLTHKI